MNGVRLDHPAHETLVAFAQGRLDEHDVSAIEEHLRGCGDCRGTVEAAADDTLIALLRSAATGSECLGPSETDRSPDHTPLPLALRHHSRYRLEKLLGQGGMGTVYKAEHLLMERMVALKVIHPTLVARPGAVDRFVREVRAAARLSHPNIVTAFDAEQVGDLHLLVMEHVEGVSLAHLVAEHGPLPIAGACRAIQQAALGLQHAHERGMVHRDIKPHNLMRTVDGQVKVLDFGLASFVMDSQPAQADPSGGDRHGALTHADTVIGTPDYIAPEQARAAHLADIRSDIYSLGCTLYFLLAGTPPFPEGTARQKMKAHQDSRPRPIQDLRPDVPPALVRVLDRMLAKNPADRYQTPAQVTQALSPFIKSPGRLNRHGRWLAAAAAGAAALLLAGVIVRVTTAKGTIVIDAADKQIATRIDSTGGVTIIDEGNNREYHLQPGSHDLRTGQYKIAVSEREAGLDFDVREFTLTRGGTVRVTARFLPARRLGQLNSAAFAWFPDECTFFAGRDLRIHPGLSDEQLTVGMQLLANAGWGERIWKLKPVLGRIDRITAAFAPDDKHPERAKIFIRLTGQLNRPRLLDWFKTELPSALEEETASPSASITVFRMKPLPMAAALIDDTDLVLGRYVGSAERHVDVIREAMKVRAGREPSAQPRYQFLSARVPTEAWGIVVGDVPEAIRGALTQVLTPLNVLPPADTPVGYVQWPGGISIRSDRIVAAPLSVLCYLRGDDTTRADVNTQFRTSQEAESFANGVRSVQQRALRVIRDAAPLVRLTPAGQAALRQTVKDVHIERQDEQVRASIRVPAAAFQALTEALRNLPLSSVRSLTSLWSKPFAAPKSKDGPH